MQLPDPINPMDSIDILLPYQQAWIADYSPVKIAEKSRRTGLTWAEAADAVLTASTARDAGGMNHYYTGANKDMATEFIDACAMWARVYDRAAGDVEEDVLKDGDKDIARFTIRFDSGFFVQALSSSPSNLRGRQGNVTIDEAAFHDHLDEVVKAALPLRMWGGKVRIISTHNGVSNAFCDLVTETREGRRSYSLHRITLDDACDQGLYRRICQRSGQEWSQAAEDVWKDELRAETVSPEDAAEEYDCVPKQSGGSYFSLSLIEARMEPAPVLRYTGTEDFNRRPEPERRAEIDEWIAQNLKPVLADLDTTTPHALGEDFARSGDLTVFAPMAIETDLTRRIPFLVELKNVPFRQQEQILFALCDALPRFSAACLDARGNGQYLAEAAADRYGRERIDQVMLTQRYYLDYFPPLKAAFDDAQIVIPRDRDVRADLRAVTVRNGIPQVLPGNTSSDKSRQRHGDAAIAILLAHVAARQPVQVYEYTDIPRHAQTDRQSWQPDYRPPAQQPRVL